ncbi:MAG: hypothetical protein QM756_17530 [Polyangiaceae bacterium]
MKKWFFVALGLAGVLVVSVKFLVPGVRAASANYAPPKPREEQLAAELSDLRKQVVRLDLQARAATLGSLAKSAAQAAPTGAERRLNDSEPSPAEDGTSDPKAVAAKQAAQMAEVTMSLDDRLETETIDYAWSRDTIAQARQALETQAKDAKILSTKCASNLCRVEVEQSTTDGRTNLPSLISGIAPFSNGAIYNYAAEEGRTKTTVYFVRSGHNFQEFLEQP